MKAAIIVAAFATVFSCTPALADANLVANGGFETGDFTGWTQFGDMSDTGVYPSGAGLPVDDGQYSAAFGPGNGPGGITQMIDTVPGQSYNLNFDLANTDIYDNNILIVSFGDGFQVSVEDLDPFDFGPNSLRVTASALSADVSFFFYNPGGYFLLDDVSVIPTPEPASWGLMLAGFVTIGAAMRRRPMLTA